MCGNAPHYLQDGVARALLDALSTVGRGTVNSRPLYKTMWELVDDLSFVKCKPSDVTHTV
jgi:hypothetical protein